MLDKQKDLEWQKSIGQGQIMAILLWAKIYPICPNH
jgi:hypothetical protein